MITLSQTRPCFLHLQSKSFENTVGKGEIAPNEQFLFYPTVFSTPIGKLSAIIIKFGTVVCKIFQFRRVQNLSFGKRLRLVLPEKIFTDDGFNTAITCERMALVSRWVQRIAEKE